MKSLLAMTAAALAAMLVSCQSHKQATSNSKEESHVEAAGSITTETTARFQWWSQLALDVDSFEIVIPNSHFPASRTMTEDSTTVLNNVFENTNARQPRTGSVVLRGKHASLNKIDNVQRNAERRAECVDSMAASSSMEKSEHVDEDKVGITQPPEVTWWPWLLISGAVIATVIMYKLFKQK